MSEQQPATTSAETANQNEPDYSLPTPERQAELRAAYEVNVAAGRAPYKGVKIRTLGEILWIMRERGWRVDLDHVDEQERVNLSGAVLVVVNLSSAALPEANLSGAYLVGADLSGAVLLRADLSGALLLAANLNGAIFHAADLSGAVLTGARMDTATDLADVTLSAATELGDVVWNGVPLTRVDWSQAPRLGDEGAIKNATGRKKRVEAYRDAARAYRQLATVLRDQGLNDEADGYSYRSQVLRRRLLLQQRKGLRYLGSLVLDLISGYGYRPLRSFIAYILVVAGFAAAYFFVGAQVGVSMPPLAAVVFSVTSFHGRGFMPGESVLLTNPLTVLAAGEAIIGLFIEITFIATFTQRFFAR